MDLFEAIKGRRSIRKFKPDKIDKAAKLNIKVISRDEFLRMIEIDI